MFISIVLFNYLVTLTALSTLIFVTVYSLSCRASIDSISVLDILDNNIQWWSEVIYRQDVLKCHGSIGLLVISLNFAFVWRRMIFSSLMSIDVNYVFQRDNLGNQQMVWDQMSFANLTGICQMSYIFVNKLFCYQKPFVSVALLKKTSFRCLRGY